MQYYAIAVTFSPVFACERSDFAKSVRIQPEDVGMNSFLS
jgi:hypothetical protein